MSLGAPKYCDRCWFLLYPIPAPPVFDKSGAPVVSRKPNPDEKQWVGSGIRNIDMRTGQCERCGETAKHLNIDRVVKAK